MNRCTLLQLSFDKARGFTFYCAYKSDKLFVFDSAHFLRLCFTLTCQTNLPIFEHRTPMARCTWLSPNLLGETWAKLHTALSLFTSLTSINPFILSLVPEAQGCRLCPELIRSQIAGGLSPYCAPSSGIILVLILTAWLVPTHFFFFSPELSF